MSFPAEHFPGTPTWFRAAVADAINRAGVTDWKWQVPLEAIGRYESNYNPVANFCDADETKPIGIMQLSRSMLTNAKDLFPALHTDLGGLTDPVRQALTALLHINSKLTVTGGYGGIGVVDGTVGLLPMTFRGPGKVLRAWIKSPDTFTVEGARSLYEPY